MIQSHKPKIQTIFQEYYNEKKETSKRRLQWIWGLGNATVRGSWPNKKNFDLQVTTLQAVAIMVFNDFEGDFEAVRERINLPEETLKQLLNQQAEEKAERYRRQLGDGSLQQRLEQLTHLRRDEGYFTSCSPEDDGCSWRLQEMHCSVQRIAEEFPAVCDQELLLIRRTMPDCQVERVHWRLEGGHACGFRITPLLQN